MNTTKEDRFAELLTEAIHIIKRRKGQPVSVIQDDLTYILGREEGNPIEYWRKGHIPTKRSEFVQLTRHLIQKGNLSSEWLQNFWGCTDFIGLSDIEAELFPNQRTQLWLPQKPYTELIGRREIVQDILSCLNDPTAHAIIAIDGMGGIGKTAITYAVVTQSLESKHFDTAVWIAEDLTNEEGESKRGLTYDAVLGSIGVRLGNRDIAKYKLKQKEDRIRALLHTQKVLLILDNLETAAEPQQDIAYRLRLILGARSKAILMSRQRFLKDVYHVHMPGLDQKQAVHFLYQESRERGISHLQKAAERDLLQITQQTGGSPLALKLVVGQLGYQELQLVLTRLQQVHVVNTTPNDEYARLYKFIFAPSWEILSLEGKKLLISLAHFAPGSGGSFEALKATCGLATDSLANRIDELWTLAFLEIGESSLSQTRYYLHALTQHFVLSDIVQTIEPASEFSNLRDIT